MKRWYYKSKRGVYGPVTASMILELRLEEVLSLDSIVCRDDLHVPLRDVLEEVTKESWDEADRESGDRERRESANEKDVHGALASGIQCPYCDVRTRVTILNSEVEVQCQNCRGKFVIVRHPSSKLVIVAIASSDPVPPDERPVVEIVKQEIEVEKRSPFAVILGLPNHVFDPDHYELLELKRFTKDEKAIRMATVSQYSKLQKCQNSEIYTTHVRPIEIRLAEAKIILLDRIKKNAYDAELRRNRR